MHFTGVIPADAPDPRMQHEELVKQMPIPVIGLVAQSSVQSTSLAVNSATDSAGFSAMSVSVSATLWRNPTDKTDPVNLEILDEHTRRAIEEVPPWPRPAWLIEQVESMRYPALWEAVQTHWHRDESEVTDVGALLTQHANYILMNQFQKELGLDEQHGERRAPMPERRITRPTTVVIDGRIVDGVEVAPDPLIYAVGATLPSGGVVTAVFPRQHLPFITAEFATHDQPKRDS
ncbi:hypothetical protein [Salinibacterium sp. SWN167]|uniref:hypothetical protein n=1 Tax=Salinibacterium sp. SWN167 TaxID=2792054 RepID=UPI0018CCB743|nr:hypothetical protein [Salinibacterium sp. SWN167]MBH0082222.1 hypothetical protein [Salinibacterium sp. SWN167]